MIPIVTHSIRDLFNISANKKGVWAISLFRYKLRNVRVCSYHSGLVFDGANLYLSDRKLIKMTPLEAIKNTGELAGNPVKV